MPISKDSLEKQKKIRNFQKKSSEKISEKKKKNFSKMCQPKIPPPPEILHIFAH